MNTRANEPARRRCLSSFGDCSTVPSERTNLPSREGLSQPFRDSASHAELTACWKDATAALSRAQITTVNVSFGYGLSRSMNVGAPCD
jgi:hypothetical protein